MQSFCDRILGRDLAWALAFAALLTPVVSQQQCALPAPALKSGEVAAATLRAPVEVEVPDERGTLERRQAEWEKVPRVFDFVVGRAGEQRQRLAEFFERARAVPGGFRFEGADRAGAGHSLPESTLALLRQQGYSESLQETALRILAPVSQARIIDNREWLPEEGAIVVREVRPGSIVESPFRRLDLVRDVDESVAQLRERIDQELPAWPAADRRAFGALLEAYLTPNLTYNAAETERRRSAAIASVPQSFMRIPRGRVLVREGEMITPDLLDLLERIRANRPASVDLAGLAGHAALLLALVFFLHRYVRAHQRLFHRVKNLFTLVLLVSFCTAVAARLGIFLAEAVAGRLASGPFGDPAAYRWAIPFAAGPMLITLLANGRVATVGAALIAALGGITLGWNASVMVFALLSAFGGIYGVSNYERRTAVLKASAGVAILNALLVLALGLAAGRSEPASQIAFEMAMAALGGLLVAPVVSFSLPLLEWLFNVLTDIRLLELSNLDNPLLRRLSLEAPGTYNHSIIVGTLAEQAAEEIGGHALLCRVAAYYHDIGKLSRPEYFVENMRERGNRHDRLAPRMSSLIIANHVKEGMRLAEEYNLPRQIRDIIPQHHGTRLITYFYRKAKRREVPDNPQIQESDYRYPGPRPQSREAAIFMMADSVEAAARSVDQPTPSRFEEAIRLVTNDIILDHQLDECDLTFSDLERIRASFMKTLLAVHHHRIAYPGFEFDRAGPRAVRSE